MHGDLRRHVSNASSSRSAWCVAALAAVLAGRRQPAAEAGLLDHQHAVDVLQVEEGNQVSTARRTLKNEIGIMETLGHHPHITEARALATLELPGDGREVFGLAMACCPGGSLADLYM